ncbi:zinc ribbon domain-containing protein [Desulfovibrio oxyclinae]|uniref:zinc ribbon domain-containing protein n=1 Tax=Desulfovibrio oxyclinae TaxID=63560 RepID=UPI0003802DB8|nr:zinc ribbon domain-containing protein [Desulfovibrio oxyclinae]
MIICNKCGSPNEDSARFCAKCRKKIQSSWSPPPETAAFRPLDSFRPSRLSGAQRREFARMVEAWVYALILLFSAVACQLKGQWWPMWVVLAVVGLAALVRLR